MIPAIVIITILASALILALVRVAALRERLEDQGALLVELGWWKQATADRAEEVGLADAARDQARQAATLALASLEEVRQERDLAHVRCQDHEQSRLLACERERQLRARLRVMGEE